MSLKTTTQKLQAAHARYFFTATMPVTADKCYDDAAIELDNPGYVSNEWLISRFRILNSNSGIIDLKAYYRGFRYI
ncbi:hypothetical protein [Nostoc sp. 'Lobaria pulmonaria (5183) cyanobiont']|uniref:hypothetical protein n=1 Tax=Nostoc sp. 'Lobaria pulmonaria (5183) cyanobiont' TaxID=1618022 RepID=UPI000CF3078E|nr:hypothetical protein [Nostoc sp. 'Lobaria pulmonaria (5183) cyanobiont']